LGEKAMSLTIMASAIGEWWFYLGWFLPAIVLFADITKDREETRTATGSGFSSFGDYIPMHTEIQTGKIIEGNPEVVLFIFQLWLTCFPIGYLYFSLLNSIGKFSITGFPNLDSALVFLVVPLIVISSVIFAIFAVSSSDTRLSRFLKFVWSMVIAFGFFSAITPTLFAAVVDLVTWLFVKS
jgi:hypothetical protein